MWPIGWALAACFVAAAFGLAGLTWLALALLHHPALPQSSTVSLHDFVGVLQLVFASVAGAGALVALVMAYRRQRVAETATAHDRMRVLNERFTAIAGQLGEEHAAVRLAGVHAMAGLADDWEENRQTCIHVLCAYLRMPYESEPADDAPAAERLAFRGNREVRHTVIRVITAHLRQDAAVPWQRMDFDFTGVVFDGGDFRLTQFSGGLVDFSSAQFCGLVDFSSAQFCGLVDFSSAQFCGLVDFSSAQFCGGRVVFDGARFCGGRVVFDRARFSGGRVDFDGAQFSGGTVGFIGAQFSGGTVGFIGVQFSGGLVDFDGARFSGGLVGFYGVQFSGGLVDFSGAQFCGGLVDFSDSRFSGGRVEFRGAGFSGGRVDFRGVGFPGGTVSFRSAQFSGGTVSFYDAQFSGGQVDFSGAQFSGGEVDLSLALNWSNPPRFDWQGTPPAGIKLPVGTGGQPH